MAQYPENTPTALANSAAHPGIDGVEFDVRRCGSGELVLCHDATLDRVTDGSGRVDETPLATLRELEVLDSGESIPTLAAAFEALPAGTTCNVELKVDGIAADALSVADRFDHDVIVSSFGETTLSEARAAGGVDLAYLFAEDPHRSLERAVDLGCRYVHPSLDLVSGTDVVERARERGLAVNAWTIRTPEEYAASRRAGVDGVIVDRCDLPSE